MNGLERAAHSRAHPPRERDGNKLYCRTDGIATIRGRSMRSTYIKISGSYSHVFPAAQVSSDTIKVHVRLLRRFHRAIGIPSELSVSVDAIRRLTVEPHRISRVRQTRLVLSPGVLFGDRLTLSGWVGDELLQLHPRRW